MYGLRSLATTFWWQLWQLHLLLRIDQVLLTILGLSIMM
jgi:hypothetical protein